MAPCSVCNTTHPTILGAPADCVKVLTARVAALEDTEAMVDRLTAALEARYQKAKDTITAEPVLVTVPAETTAPAAESPTNALGPPPVDSAG